MPDPASSLCPARPANKLAKPRLSNRTSGSSKQAILKRVSYNDCLAWAKHQACRVRQAKPCPTRAGLVLEF
ncbi:hypothetical protein [Paenibacillus lactis]|uniref:hypothetical protein n=1 Tax=Paenibacillus lactis TaxID=228574 RepID=UPI0011A5797A